MAFRKWGLRKDQLWEIDNTVGNKLTGSYADQFRTTILEKALQLAIYLDYTKGTEAELEMKIEYLAVFQDDTAEIFPECVIDAATKIVTSTSFRFTATGKYRVPVPVFPGELRQVVSLKGNVGAGPWTGTVKMSYATDNPPLPIRVG